MSVILKTYQPNGTLVGELPDFVSIKPQDVFNDVGGFALEYPIAGTAWGNLIADEDREVAVIIDGAEQWRGFIEEDSWDEVLQNVEGAVITISGRGIAGQFEYAITYPPGGAGTVPTKRTFSAATAGTIIGTLFDEAHTSRSGLPGWTRDFTNTTDSNGNAWSQSITLDVEAGGNLLDTLNALAQLGMMDWRVSGGGGSKVLHMYNPGSTAGDNTANVFRAGKEIQSGNRNRSRKSLGTVFLVQGDNDVNVERVNTSAVAARGRKERFLSQGGITDVGTLSVVGDSQLSLYDAPRMSKSRSVTLLADSPQPWVNFKVGDYVYTEVVAGTTERFRLMQMAFDLTAAGPRNGDLTLNDIFQDREIEVDRILSGLFGGVGGGISTQVDSQDTLAPAAPSSVSVASAAYVDTNGITQAQITVTWPAVTTNSNGTVLSDLDYYEVAWEYQGDAAYRPSQVTPNTRADFSPITAGRTVIASVRAVDKTGNKSGWTYSAATVTASDTTPPPVPSTPVVDGNAFLANLKITWDGLGSAAESMPPDFMWTEVHVSTVNNFTPDKTTLVDLLPLGGGVSVQGGAVGTALYVKFISVDRSGNKSAPSAQATGTPRAAVDADLLANTITNRVMGANSIATANIQDAAILTAKIADLQVVTAKIANLAVTDAQIGNMSVGKLTAGTLAADVTVSARIKTADTGARVELNSTGLKAYNAGGTNTVSINSDGSASFSGTLNSATGTFTGTVTGSKFSTRTSTTVPGIDIGQHLNSPNAYTITMDAGGNGYVDITYSGARFSINAGNRVVNGTGGADIVLSGKINDGSGSRVDFYLGSRTAGIALVSNPNSGAGTPVGVALTTGSGFETRIIALQDQWWQAGTDSSNTVKWGFDGTNFRVLTGGIQVSKIYGSSGGGGGIATRTSQNTMSFDWASTRVDIWVDSTRECSFAPSTSKTFVIPHPTPHKKKTNYLVHAAIEGPENAVFYRGMGRINERGDVCEITLPPYFTDLCDERTATVTLTAIIDEVHDCSNPEHPCDWELMPGGHAKRGYCSNTTKTALPVASRVRNGKFQVHRSIGFTDAVVEFTWLVIATRKDIPALEIEPSTSDYAIAGDGPYTYLTRR